MAGKTRTEGVHLIDEDMTIHEARDARWPGMAFAIAWKHGIGSGAYVGSQINDARQRGWQIIIDAEKDADWQKYLEHPDGVLMAMPIEKYEAKEQSYRDDSLAQRNVGFSGQSSENVTVISAGIEEKSRTKADSYGMNLPVRESND